MNELTQEHQQYILDFYFRCGAQEDIDAGRDLIASNPRAAKLYADLESSLTDLDHIKYEACPDNLVDLTIARLKLLASGSGVSKSQLSQLLKKEQEQSVFQESVSAHQPQSRINSYENSRYLRPIFEILAAAACIVLVASILFPSFGFMRERSRQIACQDNMKTLGAGSTSFADDYSDGIPEARVQAGSPWWKIGDQGQKTQSNTRYPFMLIKLDYVDGKAFICKGDKQAQPVKYQPSMTKMCDFPSRNNISYSFKLFCNKNTNFLNRGRKIIASDLNPVFEPVFQKISSQQNIYQKMNEFEKVLLNDQLKKMMSASHRGSGQNVLYCDGSVEFAKDRVVNGDDIFTVRGVDTYTGRETSTGENDIFLVP